ncbi:hypothetical protein QBC32DRAFT_243456 [Pseudoneurospora amorphoporcata]|uniref:Uncharacterized protein n=1 Tax=Pseudoneurospora amorphoporcata TaxID=241081 RepID=A0AAN6NR68_9PEZI|nr:hypothetical protein QBC32DRAFT_243456 [Pseudoneurospora amorphoporcata]
MAAELDQITDTRSLQGDGLTSLERMMELENKYQIDQSHHNDSLSPPTPSSPSFLDQQEPSTPIPARRLSAQQNYLMLKAVRRSLVLPPLSITIPPRLTEGKHEFIRERDYQAERQEESQLQPVAEPLHKQVKFLAPDEDEEEEEEAEMSDQSSICQSPSWENYGERKKKKKEDAERRKKEKDQAEKDAKAAKKRLAARLSKAPPPTLPRSPTQENPRITALTNPERSMSDTLLTNNHFLPSSHLVTAQNVDKSQSADDLERHSRPYHTLASAGRSNASVTQSERQDHLLPQHTVRYESFDQRPQPRQTQLESLGAINPLSGQVPSPRREAFPPSSSRTPMLRATRPAASHGRSNSLLQGASRLFKGREDEQRDNNADPQLQDSPQISEEDARGRPRDGYVRNNRVQSASRAMAGIADDQLPSSASFGPSSRSSSQTTQTRRSSLSQEARSAAMKLVGIRTCSAAKPDRPTDKKPAKETDYFNFMEHAYSAAVLSSMATAGKPKTPLDVPTPPRSQSSIGEASITLTTASSSFKGSSVAGSDAGSHAKKNRSLKDAARAALGMSTGHSATPDAVRSPVQAPPYLRFRSRMSSQPSAASTANAFPPIVQHTISGSPREIITRESETLTTHSSDTTQSNVVNTTEVALPQVNASEGSSSSSAIDEASPLPSPTTTPDTSRPQSSKGMPLVANDITSSPTYLEERQDDDRTLRQRSDDSASRASTTPRDGSEVRDSNTGLTVGEEWSKSDLLIDLDSNTQSSISAIANCEVKANHGVKRSTAGSGSLSPTDFIRPSSRGKDATQHQLNLEQEGEARPQLRLSKSLSDPDIRATSAPMVAHAVQPSTEHEIVVPPRSPKRTRTAGYLGGENRAHEQKLHQAFSWEKGDEESYQTVSMAEVAARQRTEVVMGTELRFDMAGEEPKSKRRQKLASSRMSPQTGDMRSQQPRLVSGERQQSGYRYPSSSEPSPMHDSFSAASSSSAAGGSSRPKFMTSVAGFASSSDLSDSLSRQAEEWPEMPSLPPQMVSQFPSSPSASQSPTPLASPLSPPPPSTTSFASKASRSASTPPVSILKQPRPSMPPMVPTSMPILSALPKHMLHQSNHSTPNLPSPPASSSSRPSTLALAAPHGGPSAEEKEAAARRAAAGGASSQPFAKILVQCCSCQFFLDMPSKVYECIAKPDAVIEDRALGVSGAIMTMVKCPWCSHKMSRECCRGYTAMVTLVERYH